MTPRRHITPKAPERLAAHGFAVTEARSYNVLAPIRLALQGAADKIGLPSLRRWAPSHALLMRADDWLLRRVPASRVLCWTLFASAVRRLEC